MIDNVILTIDAEIRGISVDMELPAQLPIGELSPKLLETLKEIAPDSFRGVEKLSLIYNGTQLTENATLESEAIWDGNTLIVR